MIELKITVAGVQELKSLLRGLGGLVVPEVLADLPPVDPDQQPLPFPPSVETNDAASPTVDAPSGEPVVKRPRGRPRKHPLPEPSKTPIVEQPKGEKKAVPCCDFHAQLLAPDEAQLTGHGCPRCDAAIAAASTPKPPTGNLGEKVREKLREWVTAASVPPDALTAWLIGYGGSCVADIDPAKYPAMLESLAVMLKAVPPTTPSKVDPLA